jgi:hypothetical protein
VASFWLETSEVDASRDGSGSVDASRDDSGPVVPNVEHAAGTASAIPTKTATNARTCIAGSVSCFVFWIAGSALRSGAPGLQLPRRVASESTLIRKGLLVHADHEAPRAAIGELEERLFSEVENAHDAATKLPAGRRIAGTGLARFCESTFWSITKFRDAFP